MAIERPIEKFLSIYPSPSTNRTYRNRIEKFFDHVNGDEMQTSMMEGTIKMM